MNTNTGILNHFCRVEGISSVSASCSNVKLFPFYVTEYTRNTTAWVFVNCGFGSALAREDGEHFESLVGPRKTSVHPNHPTEIRTSCTKQTAAIPKLVSVADVQWTK